MIIQDTYRETIFKKSAKSMLPFIFNVNSGASGTYTIPTNTTLYTYNYSVKVQGENIWVFGQTGDCTITFPSTNTDYVIEIRGVFPYFVGSFLSSTEKSKTKELMQFGGVEFKNFGSSFSNFIALDFTATDNVNGKPTYYRYAFEYTSFNLNVNGWDWTEVTDMGLIWRNTPFNNGGVTLDISVPKLGINGDTAVDFAFQSTPIEGLILRDINYDVRFGSGTLATPNLTILELHGCFGNVDIRNTALTGVFIDNLFTSLRDITALPAKSITITTAQSTSGIDTTIATNKDWTIVIV